jgi:DNA repair exonuclease SbcCD ATPase subunit
MAGLTVTEKEHWKDRIARRIDNKIERLTANDPNFTERLHREAREWALVSLGLDDVQRRIDEIEQQAEELDKLKNQLRHTLLARVRGVPPESITEHYSSYQHDGEVNRAINRRQSVHEDELLTRSDLGREILRLRAEKDNLLDTVWLATSSVEVRQLWQKVTELLGDTPTPLQQDALTNPPPSQGAPA